MCARRKYLQLTHAARCVHAALMTLAEYLSETDTTLVAFAEQLGVAHTTVMRWRDGTVEPTLDRIRDIHRVTGGRVTVADFWERAA